jgi:hypothetical protein
LPPDADRVPSGRHSSTALDHSSLKVMLDFAEFPRDYEDPLSGHRLAETDLRRVHRSFPALHSYLAEYLESVRRQDQIRERHPDHPPPR